MKLSHLNSCFPFLKPFEMVQLDANLIHNHNNLQWKDGNAFLRRSRIQLGWKDLSGETILDIGCGPGNTSTQLLLNLFPNVGKIIAMDSSQDMIRFAKTNNPHPKKEYFHADIQDESILQRWRGRFSKLVSLYCIHWVKNQNRAFRNIFELLTPGGEVALFFCLSADNYAVFEDMREHPKWKDMTKDLPCGIPISQSLNFDESHYRRILTEIGFDVILCKKETVTFTFPSDQECRGHLASICSMLKDIPYHLRSEFVDSLFERLLFRCGRSFQGLPKLQLNYINILIKKPLEESLVKLEHFLRK